MNGRCPFEVMVRLHEHPIKFPIQRPDARRAVVSLGSYKYYCTLVASVRLPNQDDYQIDFAYKSVNNRLVRCPTVRA